MVLSLDMEHGILRQMLYQVEARRSVVVIVILASIILLIQSFSFHYKSELVSFIPANYVSAVMPNSFGGGDSFMNKDHPLLYDSVTVTGSLDFSLKNKSETANTDEKSRKNHETQQPGHGIQLERGQDVDGDLEAHKDKDLIHNSSSGGEFGGQILLPDVGTQNVTDVVSNRNDGMFASDRTEGQDNVVIISPPGQVSPSIFRKNHSMLGKEDAGPHNSDITVGPKASSTTELPPKGTHLEFLKNLSTPLSDNSSLVGIPILKKKKGGLPPVSISQMSHILLQEYASSHLTKPRRPSARERELLSAKAQTEHSSIFKEDRYLYSPVFRNISMFKRSYELMERMLKVYVYKEGEKPIFHQPLLKGIYASEGWFMKLMERNKHFTVKDPKKAHLFYLPFSSRMLQLTLYATHSRNRKYLADYLKNYVDMIAAKYPFWNRTNGADHFLAACHDWASYETRHLESTIRALCNADLSGGFKLGKDVSLPETYVRASGNPLNGLGGNPADQRPTLAFYAGGVHGYLRQALLLCWENKDPDMKIFGPKFFGIETKKVYIEHMKSSKYCICPRGYEVNSPRVVEAIFYECVPVIISDNFVPPFFEVLDWESFAVFVAEKDIPKLKDILLSIPREKYRTMQMRVKKVQKHFLWHPNPVKYDMFHMILHSVWFNRLNQIKVT